MARPATAVAGRARGGERLADLVDEYLEHLEPRVGLHTLGQRRSVLTKLLLPWTEAQEIDTLDDLDAAALDRFSLRLQREPGPKGDPLSPVTVKTYSREVNLFLGWASAGGGLRVESPPLRADGSDLELVTDDEVQAMIEKAKEPRDKLIVRVLWATGIRVGELLNLRPCDLVKEGKRCFLLARGKTGVRVLGIDAGLYRELRAFADAGRPGGEEDPLFVGLRAGRRAGRALTQSGVDQVIRELAHRAGIRKRVYPHLLRHSYATSYYRDTRDAVTLKAILGHSSLAMIERVYVHLAADDVHDAMLQHLRGRKEKR